MLPIAIGFFESHALGSLAASTEIPAADLRTKLSDMFAVRTKKDVFLKADTDVPYGEVVKSMAEIKGAGIERLGMVIEPSMRN